MENTNRRKFLTKISKAGAAVAVGSAVILTEEGCATGTFGFLADLLTGVSASVGALSPILSKLGLTAGLTDQIQAGFKAALDFVDKAGVIAKDSMLSSLVKIEQILALAPAVLAALNFGPGLTGIVALAIGSITAAVNAIVGALSAMKMTTVDAPQLMTAVSAVVGNKLNHSQSSKIDAMLAKNKQVKAQVVSDFAR